MTCEALTWEEATDPRAAPVTRVPFSVTGEALTWEEAEGDANRDRSGENVRVGLDLVERQDCS